MAQAKWETAQAKSESAPAAGEIAPVKSESAPTSHALMLCLPDAMSTYGALVAKPLGPYETVTHYVDVVSTSSALAAKC